MVIRGQAESCNNMVVTVTGVCQYEWKLSRLPAIVVRDTYVICHQHVLLTLPRVFTKTDTTARGKGAAEARGVVICTCAVH